jgi:RimK family alpha-L-glutamate ligase
VDREGEAHVLDQAELIFVRAVPGGALEQVIFRVNALHCLERAGKRIVNPPLAIEHCACKFFALSQLAGAGLPVPRTIVTEHFEHAMAAFTELGEDVVVKPLFGSEGRGILRVSDPDLAYRTFKALEQGNYVYYLQEYVPHGQADYRVFVVGGKIIGAMRRKSTGWKTNVSQGAVPEACELDEAIRDLGLRAAATFKADYLGVDILPHEDGAASVIEVNAIPAWAGLKQATGVDAADLLVDHVLSGR